MHSTHILVSANSTAQQTEEGRGKPNEIQLHYDGSVALYTRAQRVGIPKNAVNQFLFKDQKPLENVSGLATFFYEEMVENSFYFELLNRVTEANGPCDFASLDETVAFLGHRDLFGSKRVVCVNSGIRPLGCVRAKFVSFRFGFNEERHLLLPSVSKADASVIGKGNIVLFKKGQVK